MIIEISQCINSSLCITREDGQKIYEEIRSVFERSFDCRELVIDFSKIELFASPFFNVLIGQIVNNFPNDIVELLINQCFCGINDTGLRIVGRVRTNIERRNLSENMGQLLDEILEAQSSEQAVLE